MTQVATAGPEAMPAAPAAPPTPPPTATPSVATPPPQSDFIQVPRNTPGFKEYGERFGEVGKAAQERHALQQWGLTSEAYQQLAGQFGSFDEVMDYMRALEARLNPDGTPKPTAAEPTPASDEERPLTVAEYRKLMEQERQAAQEQQQLAVRSQQLASEADFCKQQIAGLNLNNAAAEESAQAILDRCIQEAMTEGKVGKAAQQALRDEKGRFLPSQEAHRQRAAELFKTRWADHVNQWAAFAASRQGQAPPTAGTGGPGSAPSTPAFASLTREQQNKFLATGTL